MKYRVGDVEIDTAQRCVRGLGDVRHPRARTFDLLVYLVDRRARVVPREELRQALWPGVAVTDNSVMQCVNEARKALDDDSRNPRFIRTISKAGYQFIGEVSLVEPLVQPSAAPPPVRPAVATTRSFHPLGMAVAALVVVAGATAAYSLYKRPPAEPPWFEAAWWKLDEATGDRIADAVAGLRASIPASVVWTAGNGTHGQEGSALQFHGPEVAVQGADPSRVLPRGASPRTLMAQVRLSGAPVDNAVIFQQGNPQPDSGADHFYLAVTPAGVAAFGNSNLVHGRQRIDDGRWHQVAGVFEGGVNGRMRLYVDGTEEDSHLAPNSLGAAGESRWSIGRGLGGGTPLRGAVDDVRVFARALRGSEVMGLHRCQAHVQDLGAFYFSPVFGYEIDLTPGAPSTSVRHRGLDFGGFSLAKAEPGCRLISVHGADAGQDLRIDAEYRFAMANGVTEAGPYFRSRGANPGDGLFGGTSAGFWVQLLSTGQVHVVRLNPMATIAFSDPAPAFNPAVFHRLTATAIGRRLQVALDGRAVEFDVGGARSAVVPLEPKWEGLQPAGRNGGSAGIAFGATRNRGSAGGQEVRNVRIEAVAGDRRVFREW